MAEKSLANQRFSYSTNANLVLQADRDVRRAKDEATGEVETMKGRMNFKMGDRATLGRPDELKEKISKQSDNKKRRNREVDPTAIHRGAKKKQKMSQSVLTETSDLKSYVPKMKSTAIAYEQMLGIIQGRFGDVGTDILRGAAEEALAILKNDILKDPVKQKEIVKLFGTDVSDVQYHELITIAKAITDFVIDDASKDDDEKAKKADDKEEGIAVVIDEDEEDSERSDLDLVRDSEDDEDDEGVEAGGSRLVRTDGIDNDNGEEFDADALNVHDIDAYWLQRQLSFWFTDANETQRVAEQTLILLQVEDERECENKLVLLLDFDKFDFIKKLLKNRSKISYCTRLKQAQSEEERLEIESEMMADGKEGSNILDQLKMKRTASNWAEDRTADKLKTAKAEARRLEEVQKESGNNANEDEEEMGTKMRNTETEIVSEATTLKPTKAIDLEALEFHEGGHLNTNRKTTLPETAWRAQKDGYEEIHVPALKPKPLRPNEKLIPIADLPEWARGAFAGMSSLNRVQSQLYSAAFGTPENLLLCAPTGAGKTNVAILTILHQVGLYRNHETGVIDTSAFKIIYVAPMKALVQEVVANFNKRLNDYGIQVRELSGDVQLSKEQIAETQIIVTTPEKWDIITRKAGDRTYTQLVRLLIIDEIHLLHDERGPVIESIIARTLRQVENSGELVRLVGLSATLPNYEDVSSFLRVNPEKGLFFFDSSFRPVPLQQQYIGISEKKPFKRLQVMNEVCYSKVLDQAGKNQTLVFVHSRKETAKTAAFIRDKALEDDTLSRFVKDDGETREILRSEAEASAKDPQLKELLPYGFAIHHAGMHREDRQLVEDLFADGHIQVLVSTMTLAWGVNLPAHTVIIKGTQIYDPEKGRWCELSPQDVIQMLGRAGRPQYDTQGEGIIITTHEELQYYTSLMNTQLPIESQFVSRLADNLNAEIVMGTVQNVREGMLWLGYTYLYIRMLRSPQLYGISLDEIEEDESLVQRRIDIIHAAAGILDKDNLIKYDRRTGTFQSTPLGRVAAHYYISHSSIATYNEYLKPSMSEIELFRLFSLSHEFRNVTVRQEEKVELEKLMQQVPVPIKESFEESSAKINVLLQAYIARKSLAGFALLSDMVYVTQSAGRILRALFEVAMKRGWASLSEKLLNLCKMVDHRMWMSQIPLRQFQALPELVLKKLESNQLPSWDRYYDLKPAELGEKVKNPKLGKSLHKLIRQIPRLDLSAHILPITTAILQVELTLTPDFEFNDKVHGNAQGFHIFVEDVDGEKILHHEWFLLKKKYAEEEHTLTFIVPITDPLPPCYFIKVLSDRWISISSVLPVSLTHLILPSKFPRHTELLDLQPLPVVALSEPAFEGLYVDKFKHFNPIQTQVFSSLYEGDENVIVAAPSGSGKTICAEFAILRMLRYNNEGTAVYIAPLQDIAEQRYRDWKIKFGAGLELTVSLLTGDSAVDLRLLQESQIVIGTPEKWDILSRRWKQRKAVQTISLFIIDELHLIGGPLGPTIEMILSRMRFISSQLEKRIRIVALSSSLANSKEVGDWLGASIGKGLFNFHPNVRPVPLEIHIQGFDVNHFGERLLSMAKPVYNSITAHSNNQNTIVFVPSRRQAQLTAIDIMSFAASNETPHRFLHAEDKDDLSFLENVSDPTLKLTMRNGVAFFHEGMKKSDQRIIEKLYNSGKVQIVVMPQSLCWSTDFSAHMVVIMDTCFYDGRTHTYEDIPIYDILQMMGRASRPNIDENGTCVLLCRSAKKEYYMKFLFSPLPVESHLNHYLADHLNTEIVTKTIENKQDAVDYLTWTFYYRRITENPNYYNLHGTTHQHLSDHLSELIEKTLADLAESKCIEIEEDFDVTGLNLGMISSFYYIQYTTIELFSSSLAASTKLRGLIQILSAASEYSSIVVRHKEMTILERMATHLPIKIENKEPAHFKANVLLQAHFGRVPLTPELEADQEIVLNDSLRLIQAMVDVISSQGWIKPALAAMELSQMIVQAQKVTDSPLLQIPHFTPELLEIIKAEVPSVEGVFDIMEMEDDVRDKILTSNLSTSKMSDVANFCNSYPSVECSFNVVDEEDITAGGSVTVFVQLEREGDEDEEMGEDVVPNVIASRYKKEKQEGWWLVVGNEESIFAIKKVSLKKKQRVKLDFNAPADGGDYTYKLYLVSDCYLGCDQEFPLPLSVAAAAMEDDN